MFDIGWSEMTVVVVIALLVLGPKQLPEALRTITQFTRKARRYAQDFRSGIDNIVREAELEDARKALNSVRDTNPSKALQDLVDPTGEVDKEMRSLEAATKEEPKAASETPAAGEEEKSIEAKAPDEDAAGETPTGEEPATEAKPGAKIVKEPLNIAPAHSVRPPPGEDPFDAAPAPAASSEPEAPDAAEASEPKEEERRPA